MNRREFVICLSVSMLATNARAEETYPSRLITLVVPFAAGGGADIQARMLAEKLRKELGTPVVVENRVGAAGLVAAPFVAAARPDGYTLMLGASTHVTQKLMQPSAKFDPLTSFIHVTRVSSGPAVLIVAKDSPYHSVADIIAAAKAEPGKLNYASGGLGTPAHLSGAALVVATGIDIVHVPYKGAIDILPSILRGDTQFGFAVASTAVANVQGGLVKALAVTSAKRLPELPDVPTLSEATGKPDLVIDSWTGIWVPAHVPEPIVARLNVALNKVLADPDLRAEFEKLGTPADPTSTPAEFTKFIEAETAKYARIVALSKIVLQ
jgi:tripartite-type tricarboxylate transporter receptor subunit TctC